jgi:serine phosphatase RsbU (regulator of sigma subunit)
MFRSLRVKFVVYFVGFMSASLALLATSLFDHEHDALLEELRKRLAVEATNIAIQSREAMETNDELGILATLRARKGSDDIIYAAVLDTQGTVFAHSDVRRLGRAVELPPDVRALQDGFAYNKLSSPAGSRIEVWTPVHSDLGGERQQIGLVCVAVSEEPLLLAIETAKWSAMRVGALFILLGILGTAFIARTVTKPIGQLVRGVRRIASGDLDHKMRLHRADEIGELSDSFDQMTDELQEAQQELLNKRLYEKELEVAGKIQAALLPQQAPDLQGCSVAALSVPARVVGGDFYDYLELPDGRTAFLVADVAGKGVSAGLVMTAVRSAARSVFAYTDSPHEALMALNEHVLRDFDRATFVTMIAMMLYRDRRTIRITNAGHPPILHVHGRTRRADLLQTQGAAVGVLQTDVFRRVLQEIEVPLGDGDLIMGYSDGVNEAHDSDGNLFGEKRLQVFGEQNGELEPQAFLDALQAELQRFSRGYGQYDDITAVAVRVALTRSGECDADTVHSMAVGNAGAGA